MLISLALIMLTGMLLSSIFSKMNLPGILGMLLTGIVLGPYALNLINVQILNISDSLREIALIIILTRAGLALNLTDLKKVGRPAILMCFLPATFEIVAIILLAPPLLGISLKEAAILGTVLAAVSPAVIVPRMLSLMERGYGTKKGIPQLIMAGASLDDIYVIVLFSVFMGIYQGNNVSLISVVNIPLSIILGGAIGIIVGRILCILFKKLHIRDTVKVIIVLSMSFVLVWLEDILSGTVSISGLVAIMSLGATILNKYDILAKRLSKKYNKLWVVAEIFLFVLVGAKVQLSAIENVGLLAVILILTALLCRIIGVVVSIAKSSFNNKEKLFCGISYLPKATVQAAIGAVPLARGVESGAVILAVAVLSIIITAPIGAIGIDRLYKKLLSKN